MAMGAVSSGSCGKWELWAVGAVGSGSCGQWELFCCRRWSAAGDSLLQAMICYRR
jgi:hypothetical protein